MSDPASPTRPDGDQSGPPGAAARPHRARRGPRGGPRVLQGADRARDRGPAARRGGRATSASTPDQSDPAIELAADEADAGRRLRAGARHRRRRHDPARRRGHPRQRDARAGRQPRARRLPRRGGVRRRRVDHRRDRAPALHLRGPAHARRAASSATARWCSRTFALNEASVEKAARERMLEVVVEIDGRPLSRWGCDGVVCATPDRLDGLQLLAPAARSCGPRSRRC